MIRIMTRKPALALLALTFAVTAAACASTGKPLPSGSDKFPTNSAPTTPLTVVAAAEEAPSSCDVVREALLTGTQADINAAMAALQMDKAADATAREYADYYLHRDATSQPLQRETDVLLVRMSCS